MWSKYIHFYPKEGEKKSQRTHEHHFKKISIDESRQEISLFGVSYFWIHIQHSQSYGGRDIKRMVFWLKGWVNVNASGISCEQSETLCLPTWFFTVSFYRCFCMPAPGALRRWYGKFWHVSKFCLLCKQTFNLKVTLLK